MSLSPRDLRDWSRAISRQNPELSEALKDLAEVREREGAPEYRQELFERLYSAGVKMRYCQKFYFAHRTHDALVKSKVAEADFDGIVREIRAIGSLVQAQLDL